MVSTKFSWLPNTADQLLALSGQRLSSVDREEVYLVGQRTRIR